MSNQEKKVKKQVQKLMIETKKTEREIWNLVLLDIFDSAREYIENEKNLSKKTAEILSVTILNHLPEDVLQDYVWGR